LVVPWDKNFVLKIAFIDIPSRSFDGIINVSYSTHRTLKFGFIFFDMEIFGEWDAQWCLVFFDVFEKIFTGILEVGEFFVIFIRERFFLKNFQSRSITLRLGE
jgi:hypothetical protein